MITKLSAQMTRLLKYLATAATLSCMFLSCKPEEKVYRPVNPPDPVTPVTPDAPVDPDKVEAVTKNGTLLRTSCADPSMVYLDGEFYLTMTGSSNIAMVHDKDLSKLTTSDHPTSSSTYIYQSKNDPTVTEIFGEGAKINGTWSPEIHYFSEDDCPGSSGWFMVFALKLDNSATSTSGSAAYTRPVVLKSSGGTPAGPWGHPVTGEKNRTQRFLDAQGNPFTEWAIGVSFLRIPTGKYKGIYATWVDEVGRGAGLGNFYQRLRIAKLSKPWQIASEASTITTPTQAWEQKGAAGISSSHPVGLPMVVEGGTAVYGKNGEIFLTYCGSGYWSDYGQGQLTLKREDGDYADPLKTESWIKYAENPIFSSKSSSDLRGAGHVFFLKDAAGNGFICYHAYPFVNGKKQDSRSAYIEPYTIDYDNKSETAPQGVLKFGLLGNDITAPVTSKITWYRRK